jgi:hypothetical protein
VTTHKLPQNAVRVARFNGGDGVSTRSSGRSGIATSSNWGNLTASDRSSRAGSRGILAATRTSGRRRRGNDGRDGRSRRVDRSAVGVKLDCRLGLHRASDADKARPFRFGEDVFHYRGPCSIVG